MQRINTATKAVDLFGAGKHGYKDGNKSLGIPATDLNAAVFNHLQEEIARVIEGAGMALDENQYNQLQQAILQMIHGGDSKPSVRAATTANLAALSGLLTVDGVVLLAGDRVLVKDQAAGAQNGIYIAAAGAWSRAADADNGTEINGGATIPVEEGTVNADTVWMVTNNGTVTVGTTALTFQWAGGLTAPTQAAFDDSKKLATTEFVNRAIASGRGRIDAVSEGSRLGLNRASDNLLSWFLQAFGGGTTDALRIVDAIAGLERLRLDKSDNLTLPQLNLNLSDFKNKSIAASGYQQLPGGLILQWMNVTESVNSSSPRSWPIAFPNACFGATVGVIGSSNYAQVVGVSATGVTLLGGSTYNTGDTMYVFGFGY